MQPFENSRFLKHILRVACILGILLMISAIYDSDAQGEHKETVGIGLIAFFTILFMTLTFPRKFAWVCRGFSLLVFIAYLWYFIDMRFIQGKPFDMLSDADSQSSLNALKGLIRFGIPCLVYFIIGTVRAKHKTINQTLVANKT